MAKSNHVRFVGNWLQGNLGQIQPGQVLTTAVNSWRHYDYREEEYQVGDWLLLKGNVVVEIIDIRKVAWVSESMLLCVVKEAQGRRNLKKINVNKGTKQIVAKIPEGSSLKTVQVLYGRGEQGSLNPGGER